jgi:hypothetical protein
MHAANVSYRQYPLLFRSQNGRAVWKLTIKERLMMAGDTRDVLAARDSVSQLIGSRLLDS